MGVLSLLESTLIVGTTGAEIDISGVSGKLIVGIDGVESGRLILGMGIADGAESGKLIVGMGIAAPEFTWIEGASGRLMVGIEAETSFGSDREGRLRLWPSEE